MIVMSNEKIFIYGWRRRISLTLLGCDIRLRITAIMAP